MRAKRYLPALLSLLLLAWTVSARAGTLEAFGVQQPRQYKAAPEFSLLRSDGGRKLSLADEKGKLVLLHFWATWCVACRHEIPWIESLWQQYRGQGLVVLGVNVDRGNPSGVRDFIRQHHLSFPVLLDPAGDIRNRYAIRGLPSSYLIGRDGKIIGRIIGERDWSSASARAMLAGLLKQKE